MFSDLTELQLRPTAEQVRRDGQEVKVKRDETSRRGRREKTGGRMGGRGMEKRSKGRVETAAVDQRVLNQQLHPTCQSSPAEFSDVGSSEIFVSHLFSLNKKKKKSSV